MSHTATVGDLTPKDLGSSVRFKFGGVVLAGTLTGLGVDVDWIEEKGIADSGTEWTRIPGERTVSLAVGPWEASSVPINTEVEFL